MTYWEAAALMRDPATGDLSIRNVPAEILRQNARAFEDVVARHCDAMVALQRRRWSAKRQVHIDRLREEYRELRALEVEA